MDIETHTIEDLLELLAGLRESNLEFTIERSDTTIINSIARQVFKGTSLTDRQFALMKEKLYLYREQFTELNHNFDIAIETLRHPLREINREKYIKIELAGDTSMLQRIHNGPWIKIRFPFAKKIIILLYLDEV